MDLFVAAFRQVIESYATFTGRLALGTYWRFVGVNFAISVVLVALARASDLFAVVELLYALALIVPGLAATVRRLHDSGRSGWAVLVSIVPIVGAIVLLVWLVRAGDPGVNRYGPPPPPLVATAR